MPALMAPLPDVKWKSFTVPALWNRGFVLPLVVQVEPFRLKLFEHKPFPTTLELLL